jgi:tRNA dimethylallyltransferase
MRGTMLQGVDENRVTALPIVVGPTGSGKSELALRIAQDLGGEIVNCDSLQIYRGFNIGTAKVAPAERRGIPHHLIDLVEPTALFTAGEYAEVARAALRDIASRGYIPVVVGGTGFYLRALLEGLFPGPPRDETLRENLQRREQRRPGSLHRILQRLDPASGAHIHPNDNNKTIRALEVRLLDGRPMSALFAQGRAPLRGFQPIKIGLHPDRKLLSERLDARTALIFEHGLIAEVRELLATGVAPSAKPFESLGYRQALSVIQGLLTPEQALESTRGDTRRYAKRQMTWFRKEPDVHWLRGFGDDPAIEQQARAIIKTAIEKCG